MNMTVSYSKSAFYVTEVKDVTKVDHCLWRQALIQLCVKITCETITDFQSFSRDSSPVIRQACYKVFSS